MGLPLREGCCFMYAKRSGMNSRKSVLLFLGSCFLHGMSLSTDQATSVCASLPLGSSSLCRKGGAFADKPILMPLIRMPDEARIAKNQQAIEWRLHKNARNRLLMRAVTVLGVGAVCYNLFGPAKNFVCGWLQAKKQTSAVGADNQCLPREIDQQTKDQVNAFFNRPWWHKAFEVVEYSSLGFFVTQQLERASDALAESLFYPVTLRWFVERSHPVIVARTMVFEGKTVQEGAQEVTISRSPYLEEIERFVSVCSDQAALSDRAHDTQNSCGADHTCYGCTSPIFNVGCCTSYSAGGGDAAKE